ncbi:MAG: YcjF family protein [Kiritimatiellae bacterium]|nr:YcjF family protein [Kiritimatiellia bacterium]MDD4735964.1 YcjF family protein [Kiritimatiellia bacterium]
MIKSIWTMACRITLLAGILLTGIAVLEVLRGFAFLYRIHPWVGWGFALLVAGFVLYSFHYVFLRWFRIPKALKPPAMPEHLPEASFKQLRDYARYLIRYMKRLATNPLLTPEETAPLNQAVAGIEDVLSAHPLREDLIREIKTAEKETIIPLLTRLEDTAEAEVRRSVRDIMLGVALSPYHSMDILIVLYRNAVMVLRIADIFDGRPEKTEQALILRDTLRTVVAVNILNMGRTLIEGLFANVPLIGRAMDDISQGLGAGLLTSATGHAAILRCASFRPWSREKAVTSIAGQARGFFTDVRNIFSRDVLPHLKTRIALSAGTEEKDDPGFWNTLIQGIAVSVDNTINTMDALVIQPTFAGTRSATRAGSAAIRVTRSAGTSTYRGLSRVLRTFGQRVKYTTRPHRNS